MDSDRNRPQADGANPPPAAPAADPEQDFSVEPDFSGFQPDLRDSPLPRWLHLSLLWLLGLGAAAALVMAGMFVTQERKTDQTLELLAASSRGERAATAVPAAVSLDEKKATDLVLLPRPATAGAPAEVAVAPVPKDAVATMPAESAVADIAPAAAEAPAKAKPAARKKKPKPARQTTALAQQDDSQSWQGERERDDSETWRRDRRDTQVSQRERDDNASSQRARAERRSQSRRGESITEKLNAAVAACRARPHAPGECNLRACDILGKSDPACR